MTRYHVTQVSARFDAEPVEICEHKGVGHPDTIFDGAAEAVSRALCRAYLDAYGAIQHSNVVAFEITETLALGDDAIEGAEVRILSRIGDPVAAPRLISIKWYLPDTAQHGLDAVATRIAAEKVANIGGVVDRLVRGSVRLY